METRGRKVPVGRERSREAGSPGARNGLRGETQHRSRGGGGPWARNEPGEGRRSCEGYEGPQSQPWSSSLWVEERSDYRVFSLDPCGCGACFRGISLW